MMLPSDGIAQSKDALVGTWNLVSATTTTEKGEVKDAFGRNPAGLLTYTADGRMIGIVTNGGRKPLSVPDNVWGPADERAEAFATVVAYGGRYTRAGGTVIHHVEVASIQNWVNTDVIRSIVSLQTDRLILRTPPLTSGGVNVTFELIWERLK
jgi:hypothetical protein